MARRMLTINEMYNKLKGMFVDKSSSETQTINGNLVAPSFVTSGANFRLKDLGNINNNSILISPLIKAGENGIYKWMSLDTSCFTIINFDSSKTYMSGFSVYGSRLYYFDYVTYSTANFNDIVRSSIVSIPPVSSPVDSVNANLGGAPAYAVENSTLHIRGTFTPTATIAAGTKLFSTKQSLNAKMTHGSAINTGSTGAETFVGISIQTNGDVYCLGALTSGVTYNIAVTATL